MVKILIETNSETEPRIAVVGKEGYREKKNPNYHPSHPDTKHKHNYIYDYDRKVMVCEDCGYSYKPERLKDAPSGKIYRKKTGGRRPGKHKYFKTKEEAQRWVAKHPPEPGHRRVLKENSKGYYHYNQKIKR